MKSLVFLEHAGTELTKGSLGVLAKAASLGEAATSVGSAVSSPLGSGRRRVRAISASTFCSTRQLNAAAAPATRAMPIVAKNTTPAGGSPGVARNMPMTAQKTISDTTRGLVSS